MEPLKPPEIVKVYTLIRQVGMTLNYVYTSIPNTSMNYGTGFYGTRHEAEQARVFELLKDTTTTPKPQYHVFELDLPNPAYQD
jgi:hypothetical protein